MIDLNGRSISQFLNEAEMYKDLCEELQRENEELEKKVFFLEEDLNYQKLKNEVLEK